MSRSRPRPGPARRPIAALAALLATFAVVLVPHAPAAHADAAGKGGDFVPFTTGRIVLDTRTGAGGVTGARGPATTTSFSVLGVAGVPATGVGSVLLRVSVIAPTAATYLTVFPDGATRPSVSMVNAGATQTLSNTAFVRPAANGKLSVYNSAGNTQIFIEVQGYFTASTGTTGGGEVPVTQARVIDTRTGVGTPKGQIPAGGSRTVGLAVGDVPVGAAAVFTSITVPPTTAAGSFMASPPGASTGLTMLDYENGINNASGAMIQLAADGRVTITNRGTSPADLIIDTFAYFTKTATSGAGFRPLTSRLYTATVAANASFDVVVGGTNGLPTRGVAGAVLSMQGGGAAAGALRAWPLGTAEPTTSSTQHAANSVHRASVIVRPGTDGKVRIHNISTAATTVYIDLEGWFADPLPVVPVVQNSPVTVLQAPPTGGQSAGTVEYAYVDNIGRVVIGHQTQLDNFCCVQFTVISGNEAFSGRPALSPQPDGAVAVSAQYNDGDVWTSSQTAPAAATWKPFADLGGSMAAPPAATLLAGVTTQFAVDADGKLWTFAQTGAVPFWRDLGGAGLTGTPVLAAVRDGVQVFARTTAGTITTMLYRTDGTTSAWTDLGGSGAGVPAVVVYPGYRLRVFAQASDGTITTKQQDPAGAFPAAWDQIGAIAPAGPPAALLDPVTGRTTVVARATDGTVLLSLESAPGTGVFPEWTPAQADGAPLSATDPALATVSSGGTQTVIVVYRTINGTMVISDRRVQALTTRSATFATPRLFPAVS